LHHVYAPATLQFAESYCEAFKNQPEIKPATAFVSHTWDYQFLDVVAALEDWDKKQLAPTVFWFDLFSNNQHNTNTRDFTWWQTVFKNNIGILNCTLLVLKWDDPKPLTRAWCLWEMVSTVDTKADFHVLMKPDDQTTFIIMPCKMILPQW